MSTAKEPQFIDNDLLSTAEGFSSTGMDFLSNFSVALPIDWFVYSTNLHLPGFISTTVYQAAQTVFADDEEKRGLFNIT